MRFLDFEDSLLGTIESSLCKGPISLNCYPNFTVVSEKKIFLFQTRVRFLRHYIYQRTIIPIERSLEFANKFPDKILDKTQLQRFLGSLNYVLDFCPNINRIVKPLHDRLKKNLVP